MMPITNLFGLWPQHPGLLAMLVAAVFSALFVLRRRAHRLILFTGQIVAAPLKHTRAALMRLADELGERNRTVLLAQARQEAGGFLEHEFRSVDESLRSDLDAFPALHRKLMQQLAVIEDDHRQSAEEPPPAPEWTNAVVALASIRPSGDRSIDRLLPGLCKEVTRAQRQALIDYRRSCERRHRVLQTIQPALEKLRATLERVDSNLVALRQRASSIDGYMRRYDEIVAGTDWIERTLVSSAAAQFLTAALLALLAGAGLTAHFVLLRMTFSGTGRSGIELATAVLATEAVMGAVLTEALGLTVLVPALHRLSVQRRRRLVAWSGVALVFLALLEAAAALWDPGPGFPVGAIGVLGRSDTAVVLVVLAGVLAWVAIPAESLMYGLRAVIGPVLVRVLRLTAWMMGQMARFVRHLAQVGVLLYDVLIFLPLIVSTVHRRRRSRPVAGPT